MQAHHGVPMIGAVLLSLNTRLDPKTIAFALNHSEAKVLITDTEFSENFGAALKLVNNKEILVVDHDDAYSETPNTGSLLGSIEFSDFLKSGNPEFEWRFPRSEWDAIALNYTSGTTSDPKGVVLHHRGAFLNAAGNVNTMSWAMPKKVRTMHGDYQGPDERVAGSVLVDAPDVSLQRLVLPLVCLPRTFCSCLIHRRQVDLRC